MGPRCGHRTVSSTQLLQVQGRRRQGARRRPGLISLSAILTVAGMCEHAHHAQLSRAALPESCVRHPAGSSRLSRRCRRCGARRVALPCSQRRGSGRTRTPASAAPPQTRHLCARLRLVSPACQARMRRARRLRAGAAGLSPDLPSPQALSLLGQPSLAGTPSLCVGALCRRAQAPMCVCVCSACGAATVEDRCAQEPTCMQGGWFGRALG
jgi:hypothetical protein